MWKLYIITSEKFAYCSYRVDQAMVIRFYNSGLSNELKIHKKLANAIDIHRKGMELVFIIAKYLIEEKLILILIAVRKITMTIIFL